MTGMTPSAFAHASYGTEFRHPVPLGSAASAAP
jgi:hypothetical protein